MSPLCSLTVRSLAFAETDRGDDRERMGVEVATRRRFPQERIDESMMIDAAVQIRIFQFFYNFRTPDMGVGIYATSGASYTSFKSVPG